MMAMVWDGKCIVNAKLFLEEGHFLASKMSFSFNKYIMFEISHDSRKTSSIKRLNVFQKQALQWQTIPFLELVVKISIEKHNMASFFSPNKHKQGLLGGLPQILHLLY